MPIVTLGTGDQLTIGADASGNKIVKLLLVSQFPGAYLAAQGASLFDVAVEAARLMGAPGTAINATVAPPAVGIADIAVARTVP